MYKKIIPIIRNLEPNYKNGMIIEEWKIVNKLNSIIDQFTLECRMKCRIDELSPWEVSKRNHISYKNAKRKVRECTNFNISRVVYLMKHLFDDKFTNKRWLDPSAGWGSRMIGAIALEMQYQGIDPNSCLIQPYKNILAKLGGKDNISVWHGGFENYSNNNKYDIVFTSPPFFTYEKYSNNNNQSIIKWKTIEEWKSGFLIPLMNKSFEFLDKDGYMVFYIEDKNGKYIEFMHKWMLDNKNRSCYKLEMSYNDIINPRPFYIWHKNCNYILKKNLNTNTSFFKKYKNDYLIPIGIKNWNKDKAYHHDLGSELGSVICEDFAITNIIHLGEWSKKTPLFKSWTNDLTNCMYLYSIYIIESQRGKGWNSIMLNYIKHRFRPRQIIITIDDKNIASIKSHERLGFRKINIKSIYGSYFWIL